MRKSLITMLMCLSLLVPMMAQAQDSTLSDEELALIDKIKVAYTATFEYETMRYMPEQALTSNIIFNIPDQEPDAVFIEYSLTGSGDVIADPANASMIYLSDFSQSHGEDAYVYSTRGEVRYVDGVLYAMGQYTQGGEWSPAFPESWVVVDDPATYPVFDEYDLNTIPELFDPAAQQEALDEFEMYRELALSVTLTQDTFASKSREIITLTFDREGVLYLLRESMDEENRVLWEQLPNGQEVAQVIYVLNEEGQLTTIYRIIKVELVDLDAALLGYEMPEGTTLTVTLDQTSTTAFLYINELIEPVEAPAIE